MKKQPQRDKADLPTEVVEISTLKPHPRNYVAHPPEQISHIVKSLKEHGYYRNIVIARDSTILAGHGVWQAMQELQWPKATVVRLDIDPMEPRALRLLVADNYIRQLADTDDRLLTDLLREVKDFDADGLLGTGFDEQMLASLVFATRPAEEVPSVDQAAEWAGMPTYDGGENLQPLTLVFRSTDDRLRCMEVLGMKPDKDSARVWWPPQDGKRDIKSLKFDDAAAAAAR